MSRPHRLNYYGKDFIDEWQVHSEDILESMFGRMEKPTGILRDGFLDAFRDVLAAAKALPREESVPAPSAALTEPASSSPSSAEDSES